MSSYTPKSETQLAKEGLLPAGEFHAEVTGTNDKPSKKGNVMFTLVLRVFDEDGNSRTIYDYIALGNNFGERKLRHAANACGLLDIYNTGNLKAEDFLNTMCRVEIKQQDGTPDYPAPKNVISDYIGRDEVAANDKPKEKTTATTDDLNDGIPF